MATFISQKRNARGFTLLEVVIATAIFVILMVAVAGIFGKANQSYRSTQAIQKDMENAQFAMNLMAKSIRASSVVSCTGKDAGAGGCTEIVPASTTADALRIYDYSQEKCLIYHFNSFNGLDIYSRNVSVANKDLDCNSLTAINNFTVASMISGSVNNGIFYITRSSNDASSPVVGKVTISMEVCATTNCAGAQKDRARIQTTVSLRSAAVINETVVYYTWTTTDCIPACGPGTRTVTCKDINSVPTPGFCDPATEPSASCNNGDCVYSCNGTPPSYADPCQDDLINLGAPDIYYSLVDSCSSPVGSAPKCQYTCQSGFIRSGSSCVKQRTYTCSAKPSTGTSWNTVFSYPQTSLDGGTTWSPVDDPVTEYNTTASTTSCRYKCASGYSWNGSSCIVSPPPCVYKWVWLGTFDPLPYVLYGSKHTCLNISNEGTYGYSTSGGPANKSGSVSLWDDYWIQPPVQPLIPMYEFQCQCD